MTGIEVSEPSPVREREGPTPEAWKGEGPQPSAETRPPSRRVAQARALRQRETLPEQRMWTLLRGRRFEKLKFRRQHRIDRFTVDFACVAGRLVVELDGPVHDNPDAQLADYERQRIIEHLGWNVLRVTNAEVMDNPERVLDAIAHAIHASGLRDPHPPTRFASGPLPLPPGEGQRGAKHD